MEEFHIDLTTVARIIVHGQDYSVEPGSLRIVRPIFTMKDQEGDLVSHYGGHMHPPTFTFVTRDGIPVSGTYDHTVVFMHERPRPEPVEPAPTPEPVKQEPTGPALYVQHDSGKQGQVIGLRTQAPRIYEYEVRWFKPGQPVTWAPAAQTYPIDADDLHRCPNGQTGDQCSEGENQCELCLADEDNEADMIERSMGLRSDNPHSPGCPPIKHRH